MGYLRELEASKFSGGKVCIWKTHQKCKLPPPASLSAPRSLHPNTSFLCFSVFMDSVRVSQGSIYSPQVLTYPRFL